MIRVRTLGTIGLTDSSGSELTAVVRQPKRFALLAYLALGGAGRMHRRDSLLALFWPELDTDRARAALRQSLYTLRRHLPDGVVQARGDEEIGIDPEIWCDAWAFEAALDEGRPADALDLYGGDLLPGFHAPGASPEFGYWLDAERGRLRRRAVAGAWRLAAAAAERRDLEAIRRWAGRAVSIDPLDEEGARRQVEMLDRAGDRAGAISAYDQWARRVEEELGLRPAPETVALIEEIRSRSEARPVPNAGAADSPDNAPGGTPAGATTDPAHPSGHRTVPGPSIPPRWRRRVGIALGGGALVLLGLIAILLPLDLSWRFGAADPPGTRVAVLPFAVEGSPDVAYLADGLVYLLSVGLEGEEIRAVDPHALLREVGEEGLRRQDPAAGASFADRLGAEYFVLGNVVGDEDRLRITATVYPRGGGAPLARASATGAGSSLLSLVDQLSAQLLTSWRGAASRVTRVASITTDSLPALKAYLHGERLLRAGEFDSALVAFQEAVRRDTTFALAFYRMSLAGSWGFRSEVATRAAERALQWVDRLPEEERMLLTAHSAYREGSLEDAHRLARHITTLYPEDAEAWYRLGEALLHLGPLTGEQVGEARTAFQRAASLDPLRTEVFYHLAQIESLMGDTAAALAYVDHALTRAPEGARAPQLRFLRALLGPASDPQKDPLAELRSASDFTVLSSVYVAAVFAENPAQGRTVARLLVDPGRDIDTRAFGYWLLASLEVALGRWEAARSEVASLRVIDPRRADLAYALLATVPWVPADEAELRALQGRLARAPTTHSRLDGWWSAPPGLERLPAWYARALLATRLVDTTAADALIRELPVAVPDSVLAADLAAGLTASMRAARGEPAPETPLPGPLASVGSAEYAVLSGYLSQPARRYLQAGLLEARGRSTEALAWYRSLSVFSVGDLVYGIPALLDRARLQEHLGNEEEAEALRRRFHDLWRDADPGLLPRVLGATTAAPPREGSQ